jgi:hypothetical protein
MLDQPLLFQSFLKTFKRELTINILDSKDAADAPDLSPLEHPWTGRIAQISGQQSKLDKNRDARMCIKNLLLQSVRPQAWCASPAINNESSYFIQWNCRSACI